MDNKNMYENSIILIGPSGAGKSTVAEELKLKTGLPRLCLDGVANDLKKVPNFRKKFKTSDEFCYHLIFGVLEREKEVDEAGIVDFGAGHSVYDNKDIFKKVKKMLKPFKNIVLLLPDEDKDKALEIMKNRSTGDTWENEKFFDSPCNKELATMIIYGKDKSPSEIAEEIIQNIKERDEYHPAKK